MNAQTAAPKRKTGRRAPRRPAVLRFERAFSRPDRSPYDEVE